MLYNHGDIVRMDNSFRPWAENCYVLADIKLIKCTQLHCLNSVDNSVMLELALRTNDVIRRVIDQ